MGVRVYAPGRQAKPSVKTGGCSTIHNWLAVSGVRASVKARIAAKLTFVRLKATLDDGCCGLCRWHRLPVYRNWRVAFSAAHFFPVQKASNGGLTGKPAGCSGG